MRFNCNIYRNSVITLFIIHIYVIFVDINQHLYELKKTNSFPKAFKNTSGTR